ncbi:hypothetical protein [Pedococcus sp. 5OH_020]|uniref:hypothetical protein n=1 Tax=Pedococcus sp. 5OH_020 TaxID=2989814 RepID=UPI0022EA051D|nr:hypothetical protein [Pedococcus sp. 5OH_020]
MESSTMTIDAKHGIRVRSACPEAGRVLLAGARGSVQGTTVSAPVATGVNTTVSAPTYVGGFGAPIQDLAFRTYGEPPV